MNGAAIQNLNLPACTFRLEERKGMVYLFDERRKKWILLTPEEWVRQHFIRYLSDYRGFPGQLMAVEKKVMINGLSQRFDLLVYDRRGKPLLVAEFKAPGIEITQEAFSQAFRYNSILKAPFTLISNGMTHFVCKTDYLTGATEYLPEIPDYNEMISLNGSD